MRPSYYCAADLNKVDAVGVAWHGVGNEDLRATRYRSSLAATDSSRDMD